MLVIVLAVLLTSKKTAKLCDFGVSKKMDHTTAATMAGTFPWMAPEVIANQNCHNTCTHSWGRWFL